MTTPFSPPSGPSQWLFQGPPAESKLLQPASHALGIEVVAGPVEATSCGNVIIQMLATGHLANLDAGRELIRRSFDFRIYQPQDTAAWDGAYGRFREIVTAAARPG